LHHHSRLLKAAQRMVGIRKIMQRVACAIMTLPQTQILLDLNSFCQPPHLCPDDVPVDEAGETPVSSLAQ
jgi:hypothetical protein